MAPLHRAAPPDPEAGVSMVEVIISLFIVGVVMTASAVFFISGLKDGSVQGQRQTAVSVANQALEAVQAVNPKQVLTGRTSADVGALMATPGAAALTQYDLTTGNFDPNPLVPAVVPTTSTRTVGGVVYGLRTFINPCYLRPDLPQGCTQTAPSSVSVPVYRVTVSVTWRPPNNACAGTCSYAASVIVDTQSDPKFNSNISVPVIDLVSPSAVAVGLTRTLTISGSGYVAGAAVSVTGAGGSTGTVSANTGSQLTVAWTAGTVPGSYDLNVVNPDGGRAVYSVTVTPNPSVTSVSPSPITNGAATSVTLTGSGYQSGASITTSNGTAASAVFVSSTSMTVKLTPDGTQVAPLTVTVTNPDSGVGTASIPLAQVTPTISTAAQGAVSTVGQPTTVTLTGTGFTTGSTVSASSGTPSNLVLSGSRSASLTFTPSAPGAATTFTLTTAGGTVTTTLTVHTTPVLTGVTPLSPPKGKNSTFTLAGSGFTSSVTVQMVSGSTVFYSGPATSTGGGTSIAFSGAVPNNRTANPVTITVTNSDGQPSAVLNATVTPQ